MEDESNLIFHTLQALPRLRRNSSHSTGTFEEDPLERCPLPKKMRLRTCSQVSRPGLRGAPGRNDEPKNEKLRLKVNTAVRTKIQSLKNFSLKRAVELVLQYQSLGYCDFIDKVPGDDYMQFFLEISHSSVVSTITSAHTIVASYLLNEQRKNRLAWLLQFAVYNESHSKLLDMIFLNNHIPKERWAADLCNVLQEKDNKINTLFMYGAPNSGKTLLCRLICESFICGYISLQGCAGVFYFETGINKAILGVDELWVIPGNADTWKSILGGNTFDCPKKNMADQRMLRTPCIVTSNYDELGRGFLSGIDEKAFRTRMYRWNFCCDMAPYLKGVTIDYHSFAYWLQNVIKGGT